MVAITRMGFHFVPIGRRHPADGNAAELFTLLSEYGRSSHLLERSRSARSRRPVRYTWQSSFSDRNTGMNETVEKLMIWGSLGIGVGLISSDHRRLGMLVASAAPVTAAIVHPRGTRRALQAVPKALAASGWAIGKSGKISGKAMWKTTREVGKSFAVAGKTIARAVS